jgi:hypothetical protein
MSKPFPIIDFPNFKETEVSSSEFYLNIKSNSTGEFIYRSSDESVAIVNKYGFVSTICAGVTEIFVTQLETNEFQSLEICQPLYVNKSNQKIILNEFINNKLVPLESVRKNISDRLFDLQISINSDLPVDISIINPYSAKIEKLNFNLFRITPLRPGFSTLLVKADGNNCYNPFEELLFIEIFQDFLLGMDFTLSIFNKEVQHDALDEFSFITSNSGEQKIDNSIILQTTSKEKVGKGYGRDIGIINTNPYNFIISINDALQTCCNLPLPTGSFPSFLV